MLRSSLASAEKLSCDYLLRGQLARLKRVSLCSFAPASVTCGRLIRFPSSSLGATFFGRRSESCQRSRSCAQVLLNKCPSSVRPPPPRWICCVQYLAYRAHTLNCATMQTRAHLGGGGEHLKSVPELKIRRKFQDANGELCSLASGEKILNPTLRAARRWRRLVRWRGQQKQHKEQFECD